MRACDVALAFDEWIVVEEAITGREIEVGVLGDDPPEVSVPGEIVPGDDFYSYADKYEADDAELLVPAPLTDDQVAEAQALACRAFEACRCEAMARVDLFLDGDEPAGSSSTRSTRFRASRRSRCTRGCGRRRACRTPSCSTGSSSSRSPATRRRAAPAPAASER